MPEWKNIVRNKIASLRLEGTAEADLVEELSQHLEDRYRDSLSGGASAEEAFQAVWQSWTKPTSCSTRRHPGPRS